MPRLCRTRGTVHQTRCSLCCETAAGCMQAEPGSAACRAPECHVPARRALVCRAPACRAPACRATGHPMHTCRGRSRHVPSSACVCTVAWLRCSELGRPAARLPVLQHTPAPARGEWRRSKEVGSRDAASCL